MSGLESVPSYNQHANENPQKNEAVNQRWFEQCYIESSVAATFLLQNARVLVENQEPKLAQPLLRELLSFDHRSEKTIYWMIQCCMQLEAHSEAEKMARSLVSIKPDFYTYKVLADILYQQDYDNEALLFYQKAVVTSILDSEFLFLVYKDMGNIYLRQGDVDQAEEFYAKARRLNPSSDILAVNQGTLFIQKNQLNQALLEFRRAIFINGENDKAWTGLALIHRQLGDLELSYANLNKALDINAANRTALQLLLEWSTSSEQWSCAIDRMQNYLVKNFLDADISFILSKALISKNRFNEASIEYNRLKALGVHFSDLKDLKSRIQQGLDSANYFEMVGRCA